MRWEDIEIDYDEGFMTWEDYDSYRGCAECHRPFVPSDTEPLLCSNCAWVPAGEPW